MNKTHDFLMLKFYTKILEACDWDEEKAHECIGLLGYELTVAQRQDTKSAANIMYVLRESLLKSYEPKVVEAMIEVLQESIDSAPLLTMPNTNNQWEN